jgi:hypothetical protein
MALKPWYKVVTPREDLRQGKPLDAAEFAVHLDQVREGRAPDDYKVPERFFERTYLTQGLKSFSAEVVRRLSGEKTQTSAVFHMITQFGGGKTHGLTLLYHLTKHGPAAEKWSGVRRILEQAGIPSIPQAATAVFVGTEFDTLKGRGGYDGTPIRKTPWGEIAYQLGGEKSFAPVAEHDQQMIAPAGDVIRSFLPKNKPCLILIDELVNFISRNRKTGMAGQLYNFIQNLSEQVRGLDRVVLCVSIPSMLVEMTSDDIADFDRYSKMLERLGKAVILSAEGETSEIIRRRLFEWGGVPDDAKKVASEYAQWVIEYRHQIPQWFPIDQARDAILATYPFHPMVLSVFERKWQGLPRFQRTRGILRLLALWVSKAYQEGFKGAHRDPLIELGTAPLEDPFFRAATFEQLGEDKLEGPVTTDICGKKDSHAIRLDAEAVDSIKKNRLHRKVSTAIFFESNGGQIHAEATVPEIRLAVAEPEVDIGNVETVLEALGTTCYFLSIDKNRYRFSLSPNLNKILADRRASIQPSKIDERLCSEIQTVFSAGSGVERIYFPEKSGQIPDRAILTLVVLSPEQNMQDKRTLSLVESMTREYGSSARTFKNGLIWAIPEGDGALRDEARKVLAWEDIRDEVDELRLDDTQKRQFGENLKKSQRDLKECVWRTYKNIGLLNKDNSFRVADWGLVHSSAAENILTFILSRLRQDGEVEKDISPNVLVKNWPPAFKEWSTKNVRDAIFSSPQFPRLLDPESIKDTISRGVASGIIAYVGKTKNGIYKPSYFGKSLPAAEIEISEDMYIIMAEEAKKHIEPPKLTSIVISPQDARIEPGKKQTYVVKGLDQHNREIAFGDVLWKATGGTIDKNEVFTAGKDEGNFVITASVGGISGSASFVIAKEGAVLPRPVKPTTEGVSRLSWNGEVPPQKWMNFYTKVLSKFAGGKGLRITINVEVSPEGGVSTQKIDETKVALRELGLQDDIKAE